MWQCKPTPPWYPTKPMLRNAPWLSLLTLIATFSSCNRKPPKNPITELSGHWTMVFGSDCKDYGLKSDTLVFHANGTFDQSVIAQDGRHFDVTGQHWKFVPPNSIELDKRRNFFTTQRYQDLVGIPEFKSIIVEFSSPPSIVFNPHSDCFY